MKLINRNTYLADVQHTSDIKIITGARWSGKSKIMVALADKILREDPSVNIIHILT